MNILDTRFKYVPPERQTQDGVLSRWVKSRDRLRAIETKRVVEVDGQAEEELRSRNVLALQDIKRHHARG